MVREDVAIQLVYRKHQLVVLVTMDQLPVRMGLGLAKRVSGEWVIIIGGNNDNEYQYQDQTMQDKYVIEIPVYVVIFGIIGGYLRYLYSKSILILRNDSGSSPENQNNSTDKDNDKDKSEELHSKSAPTLHNDSGSSPENQNNSTDKDNDKDKSEELHSFGKSLGEIALLFLAPVLAIAIFFMLNIIGVSGQNSIYVIGVLSIGIGLATKEAIDVIIRFAKSKFEEPENKGNGVKHDQDKIKETPTPNTQDTKVDRS